MCCNRSGEDNLIDSSSGINYSIMSGFERLNNSYKVTDEFGNKFLYIDAGKSQCGWKCCEIIYKFICAPTDPNPMFSTRAWKLVDVERKEFENSTCIEDFEYSNPNCPHPDNFNPINPCTGDCNENSFN
jgi:hypothetical protein